MVGNSATLAFKGMLPMPLSATITAAVKTLSRHQMSALNHSPLTLALSPNRRQCTESFLRGGEGTNRRAHERLSSRSEKNNQEKC